MLLGINVLFDAFNKFNIFSLFVGMIRRLKSWPSYGRSITSLGISTSLKFTNQSI